MKGIIKKVDKTWYVVETIDSTDWFHIIGSTSLSENDLKEGDNVEFEMEDFWETGLEKVIKVAKIIKNPILELSDEEIQEGVDEHFSADDMVTERFAFKLGANWYRALLKSKKQ